MSEALGETITVTWNWPKDQCVSYRVTPLPGALMSATAIAKQILALAKIMESPEDGLRWKVLIRGIFTEADGSVRFDLVVLPKGKAANPVAPANSRAPEKTGDGA
jgi:hypothetical protein